MKLNSLALLFGFGFMISSCSSNSSFDRKEPPAGGTRVEMAFQVAIQQADKGYCASAMPVFVCLASQGSGWEVAATRAAKCASLAAKLWQEPDEDEDPDHNFKWQASPDSILTEGLRQYRRAANANWPQAQAALAMQLYETGGNSYAEARHWMERYDLNPRRKIYGGNVIPISVRKYLRSVPRTGAGGVMWTPIPFAAEDLHNPSCDALIGKRHGSARRNVAKTEENDGVEKIKPRRTNEGNGDH
jgi:hypothetical protein